MKGNSLSVSMLDFQVTGIAHHVGRIGVIKWRPLTNIRATISAVKVREIVDGILGGQSYGRSREVVTRGTILHAIPKDRGIIHAIDRRDFNGVLMNEIVVRRTIWRYQTPPPSFARQRYVRTIQLLTIHARIECFPISLSLPTSFTYYAPCTMYEKFITVGSTFQARALSVPNRSGLAKNEISLVLRKMFNIEVIFRPFGSSHFRPERVRASAFVWMGLFQL
jgi:hypothetical protein